MSSSTGLFIIEHSTKGRSTRDRELQNAQARSHAARYAHRKRRTEQELRQSRVPSTPASGSTSSTDSPEYDGTSPLLPASGEATPQQAGPPHSSVQVYSPSQQLVAFRPATLGSVVASPQSYPVSLNAEGFRSIEYFRELWSRWAADIIPFRADRRAAASLAVGDIIQRCLTDDLHMSAFTSYVLQRDPGANVSKVYLLQTAGKALVELRKRIQTGNARLEEVVWPIIFLAHYELFGSKTVAAGRAHLKAVVDLGGMTYLDEVSQTYIRRMDRGWWSNYPSIFAQPDSPRQQWRKLVPNVPANDIAGTGFADHATLLGSELMHILPFVVDCVRAGLLCVEKARHGLEDEVLQNKVIRKCQTFMDALRAQLPADSVRTTCIYPAMIWLQYTTWVMRDLATKAATPVRDSVAAYRNVTSHAHTNLLRSVLESTQALELALWAAATGIVTSSDEATRIRYAARVSELAAHLGIVDPTSSWSRYIWFDVSLVDYGIILEALGKATGAVSSLTPLQQSQVHKKALLDAAE